MTHNATPTDINAVIDAHLSRAKARLAEHKRAKNDEKVREYESRLRRMRQSIFDAEDAAIAAISAKDAGLFSQFAGLFPKADKAIRATLAQ